MSENLINENLVKNNKEELTKEVQKNVLSKSDVFATLRKPTERKIQMNVEQNKTAVANADVFGNLTKSALTKSLKITFLGGVGEIGKNMTALEYNNEIIIVDAGLSFPGDDLPGVDIVVPDISYLIANKAKVKAVILTHGHEDHIGGIPFLLGDINVPIYGSRLTLALVENKLKEYPKLKYKCISVQPKNLLKLGSFQIEFIKVNHSIAGSLALYIQTPVANLIHTGDFKIDFEPIDGSTTDLARFGELGKKGMVDLLLCESTNVCRKGYSMSESKVGKTLEELFGKLKNKRLIVATFASNIHRVQQLMDLAEKFGRKIAFAGRSMINVSEAAEKVGELRYNKNNVVDIDKIDKYADGEILILCTGSQGEPMSALTRMSAGEFKKVTIGNNDTIILSASPIPGNEKNVYNVINMLYKKDADVIYDELADVHVSGHACQEEIKTMHALTNPKFFIPIHGEYRHLKHHKQLAMEMGMAERNILLPDLGMQIEVNKTSMKKSGVVTAGQRLIDGLGIGDMDSSVLRERKQLAEDGFCVAVVGLNAQDSTLSVDPFIITRGVVYNDEQESFTNDAKQYLMQVLKESDLRGMDSAGIRATMKRALQGFIFKRSKRRPIILSIVLTN
ncbi:MAG: ribonuclease J [Clostridia bacterium]